MRQKYIVTEIAALSRDPVKQEKRATLGVLFCGAFLINSMLATNVAANTPHHSKKPKIDNLTVISNATAKGDLAPLNISNTATKQDLSIRRSIVRKLP